MENIAKISREEMVRLLNEDLAREFQAIIAYVVYSQTMKGAKSCARSSPRSRST